MLFFSLVLRPEEPSRLMIGISAMAAILRVSGVKKPVRNPRDGEREMFDFVSASLAPRLLIVSDEGHRCGCWNFCP